MVSEEDLEDIVCLSGGGQEGVPLVTFHSLKYFSARPPSKILHTFTIISAESPRFPITSPVLSTHLSNMRMNVAIAAADTAGCKLLPPLSGIKTCSSAYHPFTYSQRSIADSKFSHHLGNGNGCPHFFLARSINS
jgi:hypothetical protein